VLFLLLSRILPVCPVLWRLPVLFRAEPNSGTDDDPSTGPDAVDRKLLKLV